MYIHLYKYTFMCLCIQAYLYVYIYIYAHTRKHIYWYTFSHNYIYIYTYICYYVYTFVCKFIHTHTCTHTHSLKHTYARMNMYIYTRTHPPSLSQSDTHTPVARHILRDARHNSRPNEIALVCDYFCLAGIMAFSQFMLKRWSVMQRGCCHEMRIYMNWMHAYVYVCICMYVRMCIYVLCMYVRIW